ncbi:hypothetical protein, partial [Paenibacillus odorifer]|uniref:hypothetical protein n=1 Tax=Paenibacillus odorifer TaxID=189426 RepID=UPI001C4CDA28
DPTQPLPFSLLFCRRRISPYFHYPTCTQLYRQELHPNPTNHYQPKVKHMSLTVNEREAMNLIFCEIKVSLLTIEGLFTIPNEHFFTN